MGTGRWGVGWGGEGSGGRGPVDTVGPGVARGGLGGGSGGWERGARWVGVGAGGRQGAGGVSLPGPRDVGSLETPGDAEGVAVVGDFAFVADGVLGGGPAER